MSSHYEGYQKSTGYLSTCLHIHLLLTCTTACANSGVGPSDNKTSNFIRLHYTLQVFTRHTSCSSSVLLLADLYHLCASCNRPHHCNIVSHVSIELAAHHHHTTNNARCQQVCQVASAWSAPHWLLESFFGACCAQRFRQIGLSPDRTGTDSC